MVSGEVTGRTVYRTCKIIVLGDSGVGKSSLTQRYWSGHFPAHTHSTIGLDFRETPLHLHGATVKVQLWDTAGQERFRRSMVQHYYRDVHAVILVFDVTNEASFRSLPVWMEECKRHSLGPDVPRALVGNKVDLVNLKEAPGIVEQARHLAEVHSMSFYLCSVKAGGREEMDVIFTTLARQIQKQPRREAVPVGSFKLTPKTTAEKELKKKRTCSC
ncbi:ras-related protein Rab-33B [Trichomycterus rosablanca]|uniref:ras-related protein Rab-33B n=1 Tax=Trichomycterus rosablanca TaxID=2290929 RepID=UPI002F351D98